MNTRAPTTTVSKDTVTSTNKMDETWKSSSIFLKEFLKSRAVVKRKNKKKKVVLFIMSAALGFMLYWVTCSSSLKNPITQNVETKKDLYILKKLSEIANEVDALDERVDNLQVAPVSSAPCSSLDKVSFRKASVDSTFLFVLFYTKETATWDVISEVLLEAAKTLEDENHYIQKDTKNVTFAKREYEVALEIKSLVAVAKVDCSKHIEICSDFDIELPQMRLIFHEGKVSTSKRGEDSVMENLLWLKDVVNLQYYKSLPAAGLLSFHEDFNNVINHWGMPLNKWNMCCGAGHYCQTCYGQSCCTGEPECCKLETYNEECCSKAEGRCYWNKCLPCPAGTYSPVGGHYARAVGTPALLVRRK